MGLYRLIMLVSVFTLGRVEHWDRSVVVVGPFSITVYSLDQWLVLRLVTLFWEVGSGAIPAPSISKYVIWVCLPFTLGGPVLRPSEMPAEVRVNRALWTSLAWWQELSTAAGKLAIGLSLTVGFQLMDSRWPSHFRNNAIGTFITGPWAFYLTTAGYFHLMESARPPRRIQTAAKFQLSFRAREHVGVLDELEHDCDVRV